MKFEFAVWGWFFVAIGLQASMFSIYELGKKHGAHQLAAFIKEKYNAT
jgi:hypothetical protein